MQKTPHKTTPPKLRSGEEVILQDKGAYKDSLRSGWKIAGLFLTNQRLMICRGRTVRLNILVNDIKVLRVEKLHYVLRKKEAICLFYKAGKGSGESRIWFITNDLENWRRSLTAHGAFLKVDLGVIEEISAQLDPDSQDILWYLWDNRHAKINQLAELIDAPNHMYILIKIRETINPVSEKMVGCPILSFERAGTDPETGEKVLFSWWLIGQEEKPTQSNERLLDIFDEDSHIQIIIEVRGVEVSDVRLEVSGDELTMLFENDSSAWKEVIHLPADVDANNCQMHLKNNLLEIKLLKIDN